MKKILSIILVSAVLFGMVLSANAYTYNGEKKSAAFDGDTYVYDFVDSNGNNFAVSNFTGHQSLGSYKYDPKDGVNRFSFQPNAGYLANANYQAKSCNEMYLYDDFKLGSNDGKFKAEAGHYYKITVRWTVWASCKILLIQNYGGATAFNGNTVAVPAELINGTTDTTGSGAIINTTFWLDADKAYSIKDTTGAATTHVPAGRYVGLSGNASNEYKIYSVTVTVYDKEKYDAVNSFDNDEVTLNGNGGVKDLYMPNGQVQTKFKFEDGVDPANEGHGKTIKITNKSDWKTTVQFGFAAKSNSGDTAGFTVKKGVKYNLTFDIYPEVIDEGVSDSYYLATCPKANIGQNGSKTTVSGSTLVSGPRSAELVEGKWQTVSLTFTANNAEGADYLVFGFASFAIDEDGDGVVSIVHLDNISIREVETDNIATGIKRSIRTEGSEDGAYVSAGLRFRAEMYGETADGAADLGFVVVPENLADAYTGNGKWFELTDGVANLASAKVVSAKDKLYGINGINNQYQLIITNLTKEGVANNLKGVNFKVVMYRLSKDGTYTYFAVGTSSYNEVNYAYLMSK